MRASRGRELEIGGVLKPASFPYACDACRPFVIGPLAGRLQGPAGHLPGRRVHDQRLQTGDRKSTRLNSSHVEISYAVFCLKKKKKLICSHFDWLKKQQFLIIGG